MTLLERIDEAIKLCEKAPHGECPDHWTDCNIARWRLPNTLLALKVAVEGLERNACMLSNYGPRCCVNHDTLRAIERELTGGTE